MSDQSLSSETRSGAEKILDKYPIGHPVTVHYDPDDPNRCALGVDPTGNLVFAAFSMVFAVFFALPLKFPHWFESTRERVESDDLPRHRRSSIRYTPDEVRLLAVESIQSDPSGPSEFNSILESPDYVLKTWQPGKRVQFARSKRGLLSVTSGNQVCFDWAKRELRVTHDGLSESFRFDELDEIRVQGRFERRTYQSKNSSSTQDEWDIWFDVIVGARRIRMATQLGSRDPDNAFAKTFQPAAVLAVALECPLNWVGFENHDRYRARTQFPAIAEPIAALSDLLPSSVADDDWDDDWDEFGSAVKTRMTRMKPKQGDCIRIESVPCLGRQRRGFKSRMPATGL